jgi:hypothetical protein
MILNYYYSQEYRKVVGCNSAYEFTTAINHDSPVVYSRRFPCRCGPCRQNSNGEWANQCSLGVNISGRFVFHNVEHIKIWTDEETKSKRELDKIKRQAKVAAKAAELTASSMSALRSPQASANPTAASITAQLIAAGGTQGDAGAAAVYATIDGNSVSDIVSRSEQGFDFNFDMEQRLIYEDEQDEDERLQGN